MGCQPGHWIHVFLNRIGRCGLVFLLDAGLVIGCHFFLIALVVVAVRPCWMEACSLDDFFRNRIGRSGLVSLLEESPAIGRFFLNHIGCCSLVALLDESLVIGWFLS